MPDLFSTDYLMGVVENLIRPPSWALDRYFTRTVQDESEEIHFDLINKSRRIAPLVSPRVAGKVMNQEGRTVKTFAPAYTKDKREFEPGRGFKRAIGERIGGGEFTPEQRIEMAINTELLDQIEILQRRMELMAIESLRKGSVTVAGDGYPSVTVDFQRDAALSIAALTNTARWSQAGSKPMTNLRAWAKIGLQKSGVWPSDVTMSPDAFDAFINNSTITSRWLAANANAAGSIQVGAPLVEGGIYMGSLDGFNFFQYAGWYIPEGANSESPILPEGEVFMASPAVEGVRAFGAIKDHDALRAVPFFPKSWAENDPSVRYLLLQSAPLTVPTRPNASIGIAGVL